MTSKLFDLNNPNHDIFGVATEEGGDSDDNMCAMIGDAVQHHVAGLNDFQRQAWEHYIHVAGQFLFNANPAIADTDHDTFNLKVEDLDHFSFSEHGPSHMKAVLEEAVENEKERRKQSEDVYDRATELINYTEWESNPSQFAHFDMPKTPGNKLGFCGNTNQLFMDEFPEGHPDTKVINSYLTMMNKDIDDVTTKYGQWVKNWLGKQSFKFSKVKEILEELTDQLADGEKYPEFYIIEALGKIDADWKKTYYLRAMEKTQGDGIYQLILAKEDEWAGMRENGISPLADINKFNKNLFRDFKRNTRSHHWSLLKSIKADYQPPILVKGVDLNRCRLSDISRVFGLTHQKATIIWFKRPFSNLDQVKNLGILREDDFSNSWILKSILDDINEQAILHQNNPKAFSQLSAILVERQRIGKDGLTTKEWNSIWNNYRLAKSEMLDRLKQNREVSNVQR